MADLLTTDELISELRDQAEVIGPGTEYNLLMEAADRLEDLDERVAIMAEPVASVKDESGYDCCGGCGSVLLIFARYCQHCGREIKWTKREEDTNA